MKEKKDLIFIIVFFSILSVSLLYLFQTSYAKYKRKVDANIETTVASWNIKINNETLNNKEKLEKEITPVFDKDDYVKEGVIAPGTSGYFDLNIDASEVDVDFLYNIESIDEEDNLKDLKIMEYELNDSNTKIPYSSDTKITGELLKNTANTKIRLYFKWDDDEATQTMDNAEDTTYTQTNENKKTSIKIKIHFIQKKR